MENLNFWWISSGMLLRFQQFISWGKTSCHTGWTVFRANYDQRTEATRPFFGALSKTWANEPWEPTLFLWKGLGTSRREKHLCTPLAFVQIKILPCCSEHVTLQSQRRSHTIRQPFRRPEAFAWIASKSPEKPECQSGVTDFGSVLLWPQGS